MPIDTTRVFKPVRIALLTISDNPFTGEGLSAENKARLDAFVADLGAKKVNLFKGPLNFQDGSVFLKEGQEAADEQVWSLPQLLQGMEGQSSAK